MTDFPRTQGRCWPYWVSLDWRSMERPWPGKRTKLSHGRAKEPLIGNDALVGREVRFVDRASMLRRPYSPTARNTPTCQRVLGPVGVAA